jgi:hypothetical protein
MKGENTESEEGGEEEGGIKERVHDDSYKYGYGLNFRVADDKNSQVSK